MTDDDIHAFPRKRAAAPASRARETPRSLWPWVLLGLFVLMLLAASGASLLLALADGMREGVSVTIDGERWGHFDLGEEHWTLAFAGVAVALMVALVVVPFTLLLALLAAALGVGVAVLSLLAVAAVALSPLWLLVLMLWLIFRRRPPAATMHG